jgi:hypothetical protein
MIFIRNKIIIKFLIKKNLVLLKKIISQSLIDKLFNSKIILVRYRVLIENI